MWNGEKCRLDWSNAAVWSRQTPNTIMITIVMVHIVVITLLRRRASCGIVISRVRRQLRYLRLSITSRRRDLRHLDARH